MLYRDFIPKDASKDLLEFLEIMAIDTYQELYDPIDKFIVMAVYEIGYPKHEVADSLGISYKSLYERLEKIKLILNPEYKVPNHLKSKIKTGKSKGVYAHFYKQLQRKGEI